MTDQEHPRDAETQPASAGELRRKAEERFGESVDPARPPADVAAAVHELRVRQIELEMQNEQLRATELELDNQRAKYFDLFDQAPVGYLTVDSDGIVTVANLTAAHLLGVERQLLVGKPLSAFVFAADRDEFYLKTVEMRKTSAPLTFELRLQRVSGKADVETDRFWALFEARPQPPAEVEKPTTWLAFTDISQSKNEQRLLAVQSEILGILAAPTPLPEACESVVAALRGTIGFDAVGLRLKEGDDYPFLASVGYSEEFLQAENTLAVRYPDGGVCRNEDGTVDLECTCGLVLRGDTDPANPLFTAGGSAWTNDSLELLDLPPADDPRLHPRNRCIHVGFKSLALIPVRDGDEILGLLHLADRRKDRFTAESVRFFESIGASIGSALKHKMAVKALRIKNAVFDASTVAISVAAPDGSLVEVNQAFLQVWGYQSTEEVLGKPIGEFLNDENEAAAIVTALNEQGEWRGDYVARRKDGSTFIANGLGTVLLDEDGSLSGYQSAVTDVTDRRRAETLSAVRSRIAEYSVEHSLDQTIQKSLDEIEAATGSQIGFLHFVDEDQQSLLLQTWSTNTLATQCTAEGAGSHYSIDEAGVWVDCVREGRPIVHNDYASLPNRKGLPPGHAALVRELTVPVFRGGRAQIILGVGNKAAGYDQGDVDAVSQLAELVLDIVLAKKAQAALSESENKHRLVFDSAGDAIFITDTQGHMLAANQTAVERLGYTHDELMSLDITHVYSPEEAARRPERVAELMEAGQVAFETVHVRKDGSRIPTDVEARRITWDGESAILTACRDISERKQAEEELARERAVLYQAEAVGHVGSWRIGVADGVRTWSAEATRILGLDPGSLAGDPMDAIRAAVHPDDRKLFERSVMRELMAGGAHSMDFRILRQDGELRWVSAQTDSEYGRDGELVAITGVLQDITDRKRAEEERADHLEQVANVDRLTGLHNLRGFELLAKQAIAQAKRANQGVGLIFCDLDGLKLINDEFGHAQGDKALQDVASILSYTLRSADAIARVGGDEFIVLAVNANRDAVVRLGERVQEGIELFNATTARPYRIALSHGTSWCDAGADCQLGELKAAADSEMYAEKERRRRS
jgi:diguanylate cyclase (GGDEF)-like protein/PAS domain S-box-containing protein